MFYCIVCKNTISSISDHVTNSHSELLEYRGVATAIYGLIRGLDKKSVLSTTTNFFSTVVDKANLKLAGNKAQALGWTKVSDYIYIKSPLRLRIVKENYRESHTVYMEYDWKGQVKYRSLRSTLELFMFRYCEKSILKAYYGHIGLKSQL